ncbi:hypothetical protein quinque_006595 [Culex quinquefasciatus]
MKVTIALLVLAAMAIAAVNCAPKDCCGKHEERAPCGYHYPRPCDDGKPWDCVCIKGYHRNHKGHCVKNCPPYHPKDSGSSSSSSSSEESKECNKSEESKEH